MTRQSAYHWLTICHIFNHWNSFASLTCYCSKDCIVVSAHTPNVHNFTTQSRRLSDAHKIMVQLSRTKIAKMLHFYRYAFRNIILRMNHNKRIYLLCFFFFLQCVFTYLHKNTQRIHNKTFLQLNLTWRLHTRSSKQNLTMEHGDTRRESVVHTSRRYINNLYKKNIYYISQHVRTASALVMNIIP